ncbi:MAG: preprotein translocase subunit SecE [Myxococcota bacterium]
MNPLNWIRDAREYLAEVQVEWKKITWPPQNEAVAGTVSVVVVVAVVTSVLGLVDYGLSVVMQAVLQ